MFDDGFQQHIMNTFLFIIQMSFKVKKLDYQNLYFCILNLITSIYNSFTKLFYRKTCVPRLSNMTNTTTEESMECNNQFEPGNIFIKPFFSNVPFLN